MKGRRCWLDTENYLHLDLVTKDLTDTIQQKGKKKKKSTTSSTSRDKHKKMVLDGVRQSTGTAQYKSDNEPPSITTSMIDTDQRQKKGKTPQTSELYRQKQELTHIVPGTHVEIEVHTLPPGWKLDNSSW